MSDAEPVDDPRQRTAKGRLDAPVEVLRAPAGISVQAFERLGGEPIQVCWLAKQVALDQLVDDRVARTLDVHATATGEVQQAAQSLRRTPGIGAAPDHATLLAFGRRVADRASFRHRPFRLGAVAGVEHRTHDLRDHVACSLQDHGVAHAQILAPDLVDVVQRRVPNRGPAHEYRRDVGHRC